MVDFVRSGLLGTERIFTRDFIMPILNGQCVDSTQADVKMMRQRSHVLHGLLKVCVDRADYRVLSSYLPPRHEYVIGIRMSKLQCALYRKFLGNLWAGGGSGVPEARIGSKMPDAKIGSKVFDAYHSLAKIWTHPGVLTLEQETFKSRKNPDEMKGFIDDDSTESGSDSDEDFGKKKKKKAKKNNGKAALVKEVDALKKEEAVEPEGDWWKDVEGADQVENVTEGGSGKLIFLLNILEEAGRMGEKVLVFTQSLVLLDCIELMLEAWSKRDESSQRWVPGKDYFRLDGSVHVTKRQAWVDDFNNTKNKRARVFIISTRAGGLGINLVAANRVVIMDASWNPSHDKQAIFRAYRFGQMKETFIYRLLAHGTMEEKIYGRQVTKQALASRVVDSEETGRVFTSNELSELFNFEPGEDAESVEKALREKEQPAKATAVKAEGGAGKGKAAEVAVEAVEASTMPKDDKEKSSSSRLWEGVG
jgi:transcriptional regulator ATRX